MLKISQHQPEINLTATEEKIFNVLQNASDQIPVFSDGKYDRPIVRVAGGWVRDKLMGLESDDLDIPLDNMTGDVFAQFLILYAQKYGLTNEVKYATTMAAKPEQSKHLEVAIVKMYGQKIDLMNLRKEEYEAGNRIPTMIFGKAEEDAFRRDLTINSLFYRIDNRQIEDYTGMGKEDIKANPIVLRTPLEPTETFLQDPLRVLRVLRFNSRYPNSEINENTLEAMKNEEVQELITRQLYKPEEKTGITAERISEEFKKIMKAQDPEKSLRTMFDIGLGQKIFALPDSFDPEGWTMDQKNKHHKQNLLDHSLTAVKAMNDVAQQKNYSDHSRMLLNIAAFFHDIGKANPEYQQQKELEKTYHSHEVGSAEMAKSFAKALKFSNNESQLLHDLTVGHMKSHSYTEPGTSNTSLRRFKRKNQKQIDYQNLSDQLADPELTEEERQDIEDQIKSLKEQENVWDLLLSLGAADNAAKEDIIDKSKYSPYLDLQDYINKMPQPQLQQKQNDLLNGNEIMQIFSPYGLDPQSGYIEVVKEDIRKQIDENPYLTKEKATEWLMDNFKSYLLKEALSRFSVHDLQIKQKLFKENIERLASFGEDKVHAELNRLSPGLGEFFDRLDVPVLSYHSTLQKSSQSDLYDLANKILAKLAHQVKTVAGQKNFPSHSKNLKDYWQKMASDLQGSDWPRLSYTTEARSYDSALSFPANRWKEMSVAQLLWAVWFCEKNENKKLDKFEWFDFVNEMVGKHPAADRVWKIFGKIPLDKRDMDGGLNQRNVIKQPYDQLDKIDLYLLLRHWNPEWNKARLRFKASPRFFPNGHDLPHIYPPLLWNDGKYGLDFTHGNLGLRHCRRNIGKIIKQDFLQQADLINRIYEQLLENHPDHPIVKSHTSADNLLFLLQDLPNVSHNQLAELGKEIGSEAVRRIKSEHGQFANPMLAFIRRLLKCDLSVKRSDQENVVENADELYLLLTHQNGDSILGYQIAKLMDLIKFVLIRHQARDVYPQKGKKRKEATVMDRLVKVANNLDERGCVQLADRMDLLIFKLKEKTEKKWKIKYDA